MKVWRIREKLSDTFRGTTAKIQQFVQKKFPGKRERFILMCCSIAIIVLVLLLLIMLISGHGVKNHITPSAGIRERNIIPPEELFLPAEPDFIPGVMLERERRTTWTAQDAAPYWQDPLKDGEEPWRQNIEKAIDELMERIP